MADGQWPPLRYQGRNPGGFLRGTAVPLKRPRGSGGMAASSQTRYRKFRFKNRNTAHLAAPPFPHKIGFAVLWGTPVFGTFAAQKYTVIKVIATNNAEGVYEVLKI